MRKCGAAMRCIYIYIYNYSSDVLKRFTQLVFCRWFSFLCAVWLIHNSVRTEEQNLYASKVNVSRRRVVNAHTDFMLVLCVWQEQCCCKHWAEPCSPVLHDTAGVGSNGKMSQMVHPSIFFFKSFFFPLTNDFYGIILNIINTRFSSGGCAACSQSRVHRKSPFRASKCKYWKPLNKISGKQHRFLMIPLKSNSKDVLSWTIMINRQMGWVCGISSPWLVKTAANVCGHHV